MEGTGTRKRRVQAMMSAPAEEPTSTTSSPAPGILLETPIHPKTLSNSTNDPPARQGTEVPVPPLSSTTARGAVLPTIEEVLTVEPATTPANDPVLHPTSLNVYPSSSGELLRKGSFLGFSTIAPSSTSGGSLPSSSPRNAISTAGTPRIVNNRAANGSMPTSTPPPQVPSNASNLMEMTSADFISAMREQPVSNQSLFARSAKAPPVSNQSLSVDPTVEAALGASLRRHGSVMGMNKVSPSQSPRELHKSRTTSTIHGPSINGLANVPSTPATTVSSNAQTAFGASDLRLHSGSQTAVRSLNFVPNSASKESILKTVSSHETTPRAATNVATADGTSDVESDASATNDDKASNPPRGHNRVISTASALVTRTNSGTSQGRGIPSPRGLPSPSNSAVPSVATSTRKQAQGPSPSPSPSSKGVSIATGYTSNLPAGTLITGAAAVAVQQEILRQERLRQQQQQLQSNSSSTIVISPTSNPSPNVPRGFKALTGNTSDSKDDDNKKVVDEARSPLRELSFAAISGSFVAIKGVVGGLGAIAGAVGNTVSSASFSSVTSIASASTTSSDKSEMLHYVTLVITFLVAFAYAMVGWRAQSLLVVYEQQKAEMIATAFTQGANVTERMLTMAETIAEVDVQAIAAGTTLKEARQQLLALEAAGHCPAAQDFLFCHPSTPAPDFSKKVDVAIIDQMRTYVRTLEANELAIQKKKETCIFDMRSLRGQQLDIIYELSAYMYTEQVLPPTSMVNNKERESETILVDATQNYTSLAASMSSAHDFEILKCHLCLQSQRRLLEHSDIAPLTKLIEACESREATCSEQVITKCSSPDILSIFEAFVGCSYQTVNSVAETTSQNEEDAPWLWSHLFSSPAANLLAKIERERKRDFNESAARQNSSDSSMETSPTAAGTTAAVVAKDTTRMFFDEAPSLAAIVGGAEIEKALVEAANGIIAVAKASKQIELALREQQRRLAELSRKKLDAAERSKAAKEKAALEAKKKEGHEEKQRKKEHEHEVEIARLRREAESAAQLRKQLQREQAIREAEALKAKENEGISRIPLDPPLQKVPNRRPVIRTTLFSLHKPVIAFLTSETVIDLLWRAVFTIRGAVVWVADTVFGEEGIAWWSGSTRDMLTESTEGEQPPVTSSATFFSSIPQRRSIKSILSSIGALRPCEQFVMLVGAKGSALLLLLIGFIWLHWARQY